MKKRLIRFMIFVLVFFLSSCSWITGFYVVNKSDVPITITVKYRKMEKPNRPAPSPKIEKDRDELEKKACRYIGFEKEIYICKEGGDCRALQPDEYRYDKEKCELEVVLASGESIKVAKICCTYTGPDEGFANRFDAVELTIRSKSGLIRYEGFELLKAFKKMDDTIYVLEYK